ncbi:hypothetical protein RHSIM_Rhsim12G0132600 [Rhododendron simsii]|uniref:Phosphate transporter PHO1 homolog 3-like n=1 Tax=Rhododendron simsii TaxID=118357 RepID=A0A834G1X0_RHOSS|nr:hypothetical protein RHSIM_Rhsim12G0132600 [Rhododendron simsii]
MKFGKEFVSQMVPEWKEAYMDYDYLKTLLKEIQRFKQRTRPQTVPPRLGQRQTLYRAFSGLTRRNYSPTSEQRASDIESQVIMVNSSSSQGGKFETMFLMVADEGGEYELVYFKRLDDEFNKVLDFYKSKVGEVMEEAAVLDKQMDALIAFRVKVERPDQEGWFFDREAEMRSLASGVAASAAALSASTPRGARGKAPMVAIDEDGPSSQGQSDDSSDDKSEKESKKLIQIAKQENSNNTRAIRPAPLEILNRVKMNNTVETPRSTIKAILSIPRQEEMKFSRDNLKKVEEQLKRAFVEFFHKLLLLKNFSFLNILAFSKIMKKYDKITSRRASKAYLNMVEKSFLDSSDGVTKLMDRVEATFIKHFSNSNRRKGMSILRPRVKKERHRVTFSLGFLFGCTVALLLAVVLITRARDLLNHRNRDQYMRNMLPLYSLFGYITLHMVMYAANIYFWRRYRVNYPFIFGFKEGTELGYREVLLLSCCVAVLSTAAGLANLDMEMDPKTQDYKAITELVPLGLLVVTTSCHIALPVEYHLSIKSILLAQLFVSLFMRPTLQDQLTSQVQAFRNLEFYICYYGWGDYKKRLNTCQGNDVYKAFFFIVAAVPYWIRLLQCLRRLCEERDPSQGFNGLKYLSAIVAICMRTAYTLNKGSRWNLLAWIASVIAVIFGTYWDLVIDWGLFQKNSKNRWLRDKLLVPHKSVYFAAMVLNVLLRLVWMQTVLNFSVPFLHRQTLTALVAVLEIIRRGIWNFFRLENEHLNNVGKYRAFKTVPLPFNYDEDWGKDE